MCTYISILLSLPLSPYILFESVHLYCPLSERQEFDESCRYHELNKSCAKSETVFCAKSETDSIR